MLLYIFKYSSRLVSIFKMKKRKKILTFFHFHSNSATRGFSVETSPIQDSPPETLATCSGPPPPVNENDEYQTASSTVSEYNAQFGTGTAQTTPTRGASKPFQNYDGSIIDYDAFYEEEEDTSISMESHGSMISHLLSQVKIGMDLTKVVLPTFILERRSLLEMYADYFAHPDLFLR